MLDYAVDPFVAGVYAGQPSQLSLRAAFPRLYELEQAHGSLLRGQIAQARMRRRAGEKRAAMPVMLSFRDGMQMLPDALAGRLQRVECDSRVSAISAHADGFEVLVDGAAGARRYRSRALVMATPAHAAADLLAPLSGAAGAALRAIPYAPVAVVATAYRREAIAHALDGYGFLVPSRERRSILGSIFTSTLFENRAPEGRVLLTSFVGGMRQPELVGLSSSELEARVQQELRALLGVRGDPEFVSTTRWERAIPQYTLGHLDRIARLEEAERDFPGLYFCANYRGGIAVANCVTSAHGIAARVAGFLSVSPAGTGASGAGDW